MTGIPLIDRQHTEYADLVNRCFTLASDGDVPREALFKEISAVMEYAVGHFDAEEFLMRSSSYPEYEAHRSKHNKFRDKVDILLAEFEEGSNPDAYLIKLSKLLIEWFCEQVETDDRKLARFLKEKEKTPKNTSW